MSFNPENEDPQPADGNLTPRVEIVYPHTVADEVAEFSAALHGVDRWRQYAHPDAPKGPFYVDFPVILDAPRLQIDTPTAAHLTQG